MWHSHRCRISGCTNSFGSRKVLASVKQFFKTNKSAAPYHIEFRANCNSSTFFRNKQAFSAAVLYTILCGVSRDGSS